MQYRPISYKKKPYHGYKEVFIYCQNCGGEGRLPCGCGGGCERCGGQDSRCWFCGGDGGHWELVSWDCEV